jgi:hypothetical protein
MTSCGSGLFKIARERIVVSLGIFFSLTVLRRSIVTPSAVEQSAITVAVRRAMRVNPGLPARDLVVDVHQRLHA